MSIIIVGKVNIICLSADCTPSALQAKRAMLCYNWRHVENACTTRLIANSSGRAGDVVIEGGLYIDFEDLYHEKN